MSLRDTTDKRIGLLYWSLIANEQSAPVVVRVTAGESQLMSNTSAAVKLKAREHGTSDPFVDLSEGLDLSGYTPGSAVDFDLVAEGQDIDGVAHVGLFIGVTSSGGAGWTD